MALLSWRNMPDRARGRKKLPLAETVAQIPKIDLTHHAPVITLHFAAGGPLWAIGLLALGYAVTGLYMGYVFSLNHIGMPLLNPHDTGVLAQLETTRDVRTSRAGDWVWAGLNYQVEHHLFPHMSRFRLREAGTLVEDWCDREQLPYTRLSALRAWTEVLRGLRHIGRELRSGAASASP